MLIQEYTLFHHLLLLPLSTLYLHLLLPPPPTNCWCQCSYKDTLSTSTCCFSILQLHVVVNAVTKTIILPPPVASPSSNYFNITKIIILPPPVASPSSNYLLLSMLLQKQSFYLHLLLLPPPTTCCCQSRIHSVPPLVASPSLHSLPLPVASPSSNSNYLLLLSYYKNTVCPSTCCFLLLQLLLLSVLLQDTLSTFPATPSSN
jgi:hypothetical protein